MSRFVNPVPQFYLNNGDIASSGKLYFYETGTTTKKDTFSNFGQTVKNTNPVILSGEGRCPNIFGSGRYTVVFRDADDIQQWTRDDVELSVELGQYADWSPILTYRVNDIARGSDGAYYRSLTNVNLGNNPTSSAEQWEEILFITYWNTNRTYSVDDLVVLDGVVYQALAKNSGSTPQDNPANWAPTTQPNFSPWNSDYTYSQGQAVFYSGAYYRSITNSNKGNQPDTSTANWERVAFIGEWNTNQTYNTDDIVEYSGVLYRSSADSNTGNIPSSGALWVELSISPHSQRVLLGGDFDANAEAVFERIGNTVTVTLASASFKSSMSEASSAAGTVPEGFRPTIGLSNIVAMTSLSVRQMSISNLNNSISISYRDWSGSAINGSTGSGLSMSYVIAGDVS